MNLQDMIDRIRTDDAQQSIADFLTVNPNVSLENLVVSSLQWPADMEDVQEALLSEFLKENPDNIPANWEIAQILYGQNRFEEALPHYRKVLAAKENIVRSYNGVSFGLSVLGATNELRDLILEAKREIPEGEHANWQFPRQLNNLPPPHRTHLQLWIRDQINADRKDRIARSTAPHVVTWRPLDAGSAPGEHSYRLAGAATGITTRKGIFRIDGITEIAATPTEADDGRTTLWTADFTTSPGAVYQVILCLETSDRVWDGNQITLATDPLPFAISETGNAFEVGNQAATFTGTVAASGPEAHYRFEYGTAPNDLSKATGWQSLPGALNGRFNAAPRVTPYRFYFYGAQLTVNGESPPDVECEWPFGQDPNHISGVGFLELMFATFHNSCRFDSLDPIQEWEGADLRDARYTLRAATRNLDLKDTQPCIGIGSRRACWMLSGQVFDLAQNDDNGDIEITVTLTADRGEWTFAGNNPIEQPNAERYGYEPLSDTLKQHIGNFFVVAPFGDPRSVITGTLIPKEVTVEYRSKSVLHVNSGTRLVAFPTTSTTDPKNLTNGVRADDEPGWFQTAPVGDQPPMFEWELVRPLNLTSIILHQDIHLPTKKVRITLSGVAVSDIVIEKSMPTDVSALNAARQLYIELQDIVGYTILRLELLEAATPNGIGLKAVDLFARDYTPPASKAPVGILEDVGGLTPGMQGYFRLVCKSGDILSKGDIHEFSIPEGQTPLLHDARIHMLKPDRAIIRIQVNPMGHETTARWRLDNGTSGEIPCGWENLATHRFISVHDVPPGDRSLTIVVASSQGESQKLIVDWTQHS